MFKLASKRPPCFRSQRAPQQRAVGVAKYVVIVVPFVLVVVVVVVVV